MKNTTGLNIFYNLSEETLALAEIIHETLNEEYLLRTTITPSQIKIQFEHPTQLETHTGETADLTNISININDRSYTSQNSEYYCTTITLSHNHETIEIRTIDINNPNFNQTLLTILGELGTITAGIENGNHHTNQFNNQNHHQKWETYKQAQGVFRCPKCHNATETPERCPPIPRTELHCSHCETTLTQRTGGGQNDPFNWILTPK